MRFQRMRDTRRIVATMVCGGVGLLANLYVAPLARVDDVGVHFGVVPALVLGGVAGPLWGGLAAIVAVLPLSHMPWLAGAEVLAVVLAGTAIHRGQFGVPAVTLFVGTAGPLAAVLQFGTSGWARASFAGLVSGFVAALMADVLLVLPPFNSPG